MICRIIALSIILLSLPFIPSALPTAVRLSGTDIILSQPILKSNTGAAITMLIPPDRASEHYARACGCRQGVLSEERGRGRKSEPSVVSSGNLTPFGKGERTIEFEDLAAAKMTFLVIMVVDRSMDRIEILYRSSASEFCHRSLSSPERLV